MGNGRKRKSTSRASRMEEALKPVSEAQTTLKTIKDEVEEAVELTSKTLKTFLTEKATAVNDAISLIDKSEVETLKEEIENWRDNMDSANMTHLPKFDEVNECADALEQVTDALDSVEELDVNGSTATEELISAIEELISALEEVDSNASGVEFPGMF